MNSSQKLLAYVQLLDAKLPTAGFIHANEIESLLKCKRIQSPHELETYLIDTLQPHLFQWEGPAIHGVYLAASEQDPWKIALVDKMIFQQTIPFEKRTAARTTGKRLLKLARTLYPWMNFEQLEIAIQEYDAIGCLTTIHAWINHQLGNDREQAVASYYFTLLSCCMSRAVRLLDMTIRDASLLTDRLANEMQQQWLIESHHRATIYTDVSLTRTCY